MSTKKNKKMIGGIPVYPGGYSCVFKPQLKCKTETKRTRKINEKNKNNDKGISKLLFKKYADIEMRNIENFYNALKKIPRSHKYFLFTKTKTCPPAKISKNDLRGFDEMCTNFTSHDVNESNINSPSVIRSLKLINMPDSGISVNEWLFYKEKNNRVATVATPLTTSRIKAFNKVISKLIVNAIAPMNREGVIHNDMKEDNILIKDRARAASHKNKDSKIIPASTIIDWGISGISTQDEPIPEVIMNRYISVSNPFSSILFTTEFSKNYSDFLKQNGIIDVDIRSMQNDFAFQQKLRDFSLSQYLKHKETGHYSNIQRFFTNAFNLFPEFFSPSSSSSSLSDSSQTKTPDELYHALASSYISDVLFHFTEIDKRDGIARFQYVAYFTKVYIFNCDIWGTAFCYSVFFSFQDKYKYNEYIGFDPSAYLQFLWSILSIYMNQIMINGHEKINVSKLINSIQKSL
jgi:tRNA A-37 threonylcarbamoyl transferase component Bud32